MLNLLNELIVKSGQRFTAFDSIILLVLQHYCWKISGVWIGSFLGEPYFLI